MVFAYDGSNSLISNRRLNLETRKALIPNISSFSTDDENSLKNGVLRKKERTRLKWTAIPDLLSFFKNRIAIASYKNPTIYS